MGRTRRALAACAPFVAAVAFAGSSAAPASATECPAKAVTQVPGDPAYSHERGCILSFDGTPIVYNLFEPPNPKPGSLYAVLEGPGWSGGGATTPNAGLIKAGFAYLTWDPRGFGQSGGTAMTDAPEWEGRDVSALIDHVLTGRPEIAVNRGGKGGQPRYYNDTRQHNTVGKPAVGMIGGSYGGAIQLATAAYDDRVKAIVPAMTWSDLNYALWPNGVAKLAWTRFLYQLGLTNSLSSHAQAIATGGASGDGGLQLGGLDSGHQEGAVKADATGAADAEMLEWGAKRSVLAGYRDAMPNRAPNVPTLVIQSAADTLFNLTDGWNTFRRVKARNPRLPVKMLAVCSGHVLCSPGSGYSDDAGPRAAIAPGTSVIAMQQKVTLAWLRRYLRGERPWRDPLPATVVYQNQRGEYFGNDTFPTPDRPGRGTTYVRAPLNGTLAWQGQPTGPGGGTADKAFTDAPTERSDPGQLTVPILTAPKDADVPVVGIGRVEATVTVDGSATTLFLRLIDRTTGGVVDFQTVPVRVEPGTHRIALDLPGVAYDVPAGGTLDLQVSASTDTYARNRGTATVTLAGGTVSVPALTPRRR
jgi:ABC-2 type transport system ATP-binding protein